MTTFASATMRRRRMALALAGLLSLAAMPAFAAYPEQPVRLVVGFPPGGGGDLYGRLIANALGKSIFDYHSENVRSHQEDWAKLLRWLKKHA